MHKMQEKEDEGMKSEGLSRLLIAASMSLLFIVSAYVIIKTYRYTSKSSSFVGYSQSCWQINDTLHVVTAKGDTVRLDVSRLEGER